MTFAFSILASMKNGVDRLAFTLLTHIFTVPHYLTSYRCLPLKARLSIIYAHLMEELLLYKEIFRSDAYRTTPSKRYSLLFNAYSTEIMDM
jgi:hypothetical protein